MFIRKKEVLALVQQAEQYREDLTTAQLHLEDQDWIALSSESTKEIGAADYLENHEACYAAFRTNPLAKRIVRFMSLFSLGGGLKLITEEPEVLAVVEGFWANGKNQMGIFARQMVEELSIYGEIFVRFFYNEDTGKTYVACIDPSEIVFIQTDPQNVRETTSYWRRYRELTNEPTVGADGSVHLNYRWDLEEIKRVREDGLLNVQHIKINSMSNTTRGVSDILDTIKWLERYEQWLTDRVLLNKMRNLFHYDVTIQGGNAKDVRAYLAALKGKKVEEGATVYEASSSTTIKPAAFRVHTDKIKWEVIQPRIDATDAKEDGRAIKLMVCAGAGMPEHWLGDSGNANLATAKAMDLPTLKQFEDRQELLKMEFGTMLKQVVQCQRLYGGTLPKVPDNGSDDYDDSVTLEFAPMEEEDKVALAGAFKQISDAVAALVSQKYISRKTGNKILAKIEPLVNEWDGEGGEAEKIQEENPEDEQQVKGRVLPVGKGLKPDMPGEGKFPEAE